ncbi:probable glutamate receptor [Rhipicephalus sanguineus]|uniref:probable glutamate receptor n=1 Tax=Rhipicephalus sanguineus TaxID=34632 RepID=UPI0020C2BBDE|nr:probable glutamate receptor [Rhipicephalus sanguineus]
MGQVLDALTNSLNMTFEATLPSDGQVGIRLPNGSWTGAVGNVQRREVDMTIVAMIQSHSRMAVGQYGPPIMYVQLGILSGTGVSTSNVFGYILTFDWKVWALLLSAVHGLVG